MSQTWWWGWRWGRRLYWQTVQPARGGRPGESGVAPNGRAGGRSPAAPVAGIAFNGWTLDTTRCELIDPQRNTVPLTRGEYGLLLALTQNARRVLSRDRLLELTHSESADVFDRTIDVLIMRLRRKIEANPHQPALIKTIRGLGYVFATDVSRPEQAA